MIYREERGGRTSSFRAENYYNVWAMCLHPPWWQLNISLTQYHLSWLSWSARRLESPLQTIPTCCCFCNMSSTCQPACSEPLLQISGMLTYLPVMVLRTNPCCSIIITNRLTSNICLSLTEYQKDEEILNKTQNSYLSLLLAYFKRLFPYHKTLNI